MNRYRQAISLWPLTVILVSGGISVLSGCDAMQNAGLKPPPVVTPAEEKKDLDRRIAEIQNDPNIRDETKRRSIDMMRATSGQSSDAPSGSGGRPKTTK